MVSRLKQSGNRLRIWNKTHSGGDQAATGIRRIEMKRILIALVIGIALVPAVVSAQDIDFSISAYERIKCQYEGDEIEIGFKSVFLLEILSNIGSQDVMIELADPTRAGLFLPVITDNESEDLLMLLMPMMINA